MSLTIEKLKEQLNVLVNNRDVFAQNYQQTIGQINLVQEQIKMLLVDESIAKANAEKEAAEKLAQQSGDNNAIEEGNKPEDSLSEYQDGNCGGETTEASGSDSIEQSGQEQQE